MQLIIIASQWFVIAFLFASTLFVLGWVLTKWRGERWL